MGKQTSDQRIFKFAPTPWDGQKGFWAALNRLVYQIEGPAQLGSGDGEPAYRDTSESACPLCGHPMREHSMDRGGPGEKTFVHCPA